MVTPAEQLLDLELPDGWRVIERILPSAAASGGVFSKGYLVENEDGRRAYLKALDYSGALRTPDPATVLQAMTSAYLHERDLLRRCSERRLDRVVLAVGDGAITVDPANPAGVVQYLILELADGDVRNHLDQMDRVDVAWILRSLHHVTVGLRQLHGQGIAHQDLKLSNVLVFDERYSKVGDLGRAVSRNAPAPHRDLAVAGDRSYAPVELLYGYVPPDWNTRRFACDAYLVGSMVVFFITGLSITSLILQARAVSTLADLGGQLRRDSAVSSRRLRQSRPRLRTRSTGESSGRAGSNREAAL